MTLTGYIVGTKGNTGRGIASIVENADYTITINLTDGTSYTTAPIAGFTAVEFDENYDLVVTKTDGTTETVETDIADYNTLLEGYKSDTYSYMQGAVNSASSAYSSAQSASGSASDAGAYAGQAYNYATSAQTSATSASSSATAAGTAKTAAETAQGKAEDAQEAAETAQGKAEDAQEAAETAATNANTYQGWAQDYANNAQTQAGYASTYKQAAYDSQVAAAASALVSEGYANGEQNGTPVTSDSPYYENNAKYYSEEAAASAASLTVDDELDGSSTNPVQNKVIKGALDTKANIDGYYESLGSGTADQLASNIYEEDNVPYNFRTSGGSIDIGDRETDMLVGGTVAWNQLVKNGDFADGTTNWAGQYCSISANGGVLTATVTSENTAGRIEQGRTLITGHKYLLKETIKSSVSTRVSLAYRYVGGVKYALGLDTSANNWAEASTVFNAETQGSQGMLYLYYNSYSEIEVGSTIQYKDIALFDLTAMFGSTIADYIYALEQATAGAGVAWFRQYFPKDYYPYDPGTLRSVEGVSAHETVGFNQWDEEWVNAYHNVRGEQVADARFISCKNKIRVLPNTTYYFKSPNVDFELFEYDSNGDFIRQSSSHLKNTTFTTGTNTGYIEFSSRVANALTTCNHDICINLSWDGERDGEYEEYVKHTYPLDSSLTLRGVPKLDASNNLYYDGDTYEADGTVTRKYGIVDLGTVTWSNGRTMTSGVYRKRADISGIKRAVSASVVGNAICSKYVNVTANNTYMLKVGMCVDNATDSVYIYDENYTSSDDQAAFKAAMSGVYLVYELATPTTETADPFTNPQIVNDFGTEEYVDYAVSQGSRDVAIPVGHETQYMANLKAKLEMSPNSPGGAGDYIVRQTNGENEYVTLASNATIQDIIARLEALEGGGE